MNNVIPSPGHGVKKLYISETVFFAINNIPAVDRTTLEKFLELVNATGTFGVLSHEQILTKMRLTLRYIPNACPHSLDILAELLEIPATPGAGGASNGIPAHLSLSQAGFITSPVNQANVPAA